MTEEERNLDFIIAELEQENRLLRARNERLENEVKEFRKLLEDDGK